MTCARRTQADRWVTHLAAARQFHTREGHLNVRLNHVEQMEDSTEVKLGGWLDNTRRRAARVVHRAALFANAIRRLSG
ncbi:MULTISPECIES: Helicase associated domain protein [unclassified Streptomyces]|uniref:Helicase associated domain protein n=1 Tax=unclassified Streptomyces TaxID=2593676 RepID=UPI00364FDE2E